MNSIISIIVPLYNAEKYIEKCLNSIIKQTYIHIEIIIVDDGSTDMSGKIADKYALEDSRIKVIHQSNQGVSVARNNGLKSVSGEFVTFVDSDDWIELNMLECLYMESQREKSDIVICGWLEEKGDTKQEKVLGIKEDTLSLNQVNNMKNLIEYSIGNDFGSWAKLFRTEVILKNSIFFPENIPLGEDYIFILRFLTYAKTASFLNSPLYHYRFVENSAVNKVYECSMDYYLMIDFEKRKMMDCCNMNNKTMQIEADQFIANKLFDCILQEVNPKSSRGKYGRIKKIMNMLFSKKITYLLDGKMNFSASILRLFVQRNLAFIVCILTYILFFKNKFIVPIKNQI